MKRTTLFAVLALGLAISAAVAAQGKSPKGDSNLSQQLDRLGVEYEITDSGNYSITYDLEGRSQVVYVMGKTHKVDETEVREIWSRAGTFDSLPSADQMQSLLEESGTRQIGFWSLEEASDGGYIVYFSVKVPIYLTDSDLGSLLNYTANQADQKEEELFSADDE